MSIEEIHFGAIVDVGLSRIEVMFAKYLWKVLASVGLPTSTTYLLYIWLVSQS